MFQSLKWVQPPIDGARVTYGGEVLWFQSLKWVQPPIDLLPPDKFRPHDKFQSLKWVQPPIDLATLSIIRNPKAVSIPQVGSASDRLGNNAAGRHQCICFNPSSGFSLRSTTIAARSHRQRLQCFNPSSGFSLRSTASIALHPSPMRKFQSLKWVQPPIDATERHNRNGHTSCFNPSSGFSLRSTLYRRRLQTTTLLFQSLKWVQPPIDGCPAPAIPATRWFQSLKWVQPPIDV